MNEDSVVTNQPLPSLFLNNNTPHKQGGGWDGHSNYQLAYQP